MIQLSYSTFGLTNLPFLEAIDAVARAGYAGVELSFHRDQFNPFNLGEADLDAVRARLDAARIVPACVATASHFFTPSRPHEPSLLTLDAAGRKRRIDLVKRGIRVARRLGVKLVTFGSGFLREEHVRQPAVDPGELLADSIRECLREIRDDEDITLLIEPEPGMYIETLAQGLALIRAVGSPRFALHIDICHAYCSEPDYIGALAQAAPFARYLHISDAREGRNLRIVRDDAVAGFDLDAASTLVYFPDTADYLLLDRRHPLYFGEHTPDPARRRRIDALLAQAGIDRPAGTVDYGSLYAGASPLDDEIFTYLISVPGLSFDVLERAWPIVAHLRGVRGPALFERMVANTRTGIVHFHEIPGEGTLDLAASFRALNAHGFDGFGSVELYHHVEGWQQALDDSYRHLAAIAQPA
ncbi:MULTISPECIES: sugar phosphate isomerase/epimerase family protein [Rhodanobacter]|uniref:sugar phosphate isomerase/epimerase family protein n=1 Tax=Rhodanobacter TaxID=75309 RepID=UPI000400D5B2|nr:MULTISPECIES: sugar phosphate isomerase/epimerase family protein [Rhodanobacter]KZC20643.1 xylose isomerase [Rhodanobacter denitrificans]UJJ50788.1 sugar phosphate isomerase/epimerase [Rhodanobacter denitrificans]UJM93503.1 sugar phosphate isomerase/epimerase [Rhodanobacter denitrificans]UJM97034.1 sugar phosphate isomerase/epimerase [Rhodanobacter denitrificans]UJN20138.1 sugar phosphate isomerase/epimerase [Rhodanobacter denitrificans]